MFVFLELHQMVKSGGWFHHFRIIPFIVGLTIGYGLIVFYKTPPTVIYEFPHPDNIHNRVYKDKNGVCYSYTVSDADCDKNEATLKPYPLQS